MSIDDLARASAQDVRAVARGRVDVPAGRVALARAVRNRHRRVVTGWVVVLAVVAMVLAGVTARDVLRRPAPAVPAPKIVRASGNGIILVRAGHVVAISPATGGTSPAQYGLLDKSDAHLVGWSPDGSKLAYVWANKLWVRDQQGRPVMSMQAPTLQMFEPLMWSADGGTFVGLSAGYQIWVKPLSGPARTVPVPEAQRRQLYWGWSASLSPNGRQIAFVAFTDPQRMNKTLFVMGIDGQGLRQLPAAASRELGPEHVAWSPDGSRIAYLEDGPITGGRVQSTVMLIDPLTGHRTRLGSAGEAADSKTVWPNITWAPDGQMLAFIGKGVDGNPNWGVYTIALNGATQQMTGVGQLVDNDLLWQPIG